MGRQIVIIIAALLLSSCYDSFDEYDASGTHSVTELANTTIEQIHKIYEDGVREINQDLIVEGVITANDEFGNFFKSFIIESDGYAIEVLDGLFDSYVRHPIGATVRLKLDGLAIDRYLGVLRTGLVAPLTTTYELDYMSSEAIVDLHVSITELDCALTAHPTTISQLEQASAGRLISIDELTLHTEDGVQREWEGYALFRDAALDSIWCYSSSYADFAQSKIPQDQVSLSGILEYGSTDSYTNQFIIKLRGEQDCIY